MPGFEDIIRKISEYNNSSMLYLLMLVEQLIGGAKQKHYMDGVVPHPPCQDREHSLML